MAAVFSSGRKGRHSFSAQHGAAIAIAHEHCREYDSDFNSAKIIKDEYNVLQWCFFFPNPQCMKKNTYTEQ